MFSWFEKRLDPCPHVLPKRPPEGFWGFLWFCTQGARFLLLWMVTCTALIGIFEAILFSILGRMVDWLVHVHPETLWIEKKGVLLSLGLMILGSVLLLTIQTLVKYSGLSANLPMRLRWLFHRYLLEQSVAFYHDEFAGRLSAKVMQTAQAVRECLMILLDAFVFLGIYFIMLLVVLAQFNDWLMLPFVVWVILYGTMLYNIVPRLGRASADQADARSIITGRVTDAYVNVMTVKLFSHSQRESHFLRGAVREFLVTAYRQMRLICTFEILNQLLNILLILAISSLGLWLWSHNVATIGAVAASIAIALRINGISRWMMSSMTLLFDQVGTVRDGVTMLSRAIKVKDIPGAHLLKVTQGTIDFKDVCFAYHPSHPVIKHLTLILHSGERVGLVGRSGVGKSTIVNLLLRFYDVDAGCILIDGQNIAHVQQHSLRSHIGMVTQDTALFHRSVRDNLLYGKPEATEAEMIAAAKKAHAHGFIQALEDAKGRKGYDAHVGERGVNLSGGQRQRIAIARVMLKDAPILILDEATSALDSEVEQAIQQNLYQLMEGKTVLAIAHRLSTIAAMDRLIVFDDGQIAEEGTHEALLQKDGLYARLWQRQSGGFLGHQIPA